MQEKECEPRLDHRDEPEGTGKSSNGKAPEFSLNEPFELVTDGKNEDSETEEDISWKNEVQSHAASAQNKQALLNQMWQQSLFK